MFDIQSICFNNYNKDEFHDKWLDNLLKETLLKKSEAISRKHGWSDNCGSASWQQLNFAIIRNIVKLRRKTFLILGRVTCSRYPFITGYLTLSNPGENGLVPSTKPQH
jgi:hypothetical protein